MTEVVIDSNVLAVANHLADHASHACVESSIERLMKVQRGGRVVLDDAGRILCEYGHHCKPWNPQRVGDQFLRWLLQVRATPSRCERVTLTATGDPSRPFAEFPNDPCLASFDQDDHVYVAAALASQADPAILNAVDTDWWHFREPLRKHGIQIEFLCPEHMCGGRS